MKKIKVLPLVLISLVAMVVSGAVLYFVFNYDASMTGNIEAGESFEGLETVVYLDGSLMDGGTMTLDMDIATIDKGAELNFSHTILSVNHPGMAWINITFEDISDPLHEWYGFDSWVEPSILNLEPGVEATFTNWYTMEEYWSGAVNPLVWSESVEILIWIQAFLYVDGQTVTNCIPGSPHFFPFETTDPINYPTGYFEITDVQPGTMTGSVTFQLNGGDTWGIVVVAAQQDNGKTVIVSYLDSLGDPAQITGVIQTI